MRTRSFPTLWLPGSVRKNLPRAFFVIPASTVATFSLLCVRLAARHRRGRSHGQKKRPTSARARLHGAIPGKNSFAPSFAADSGIIIAVAELTLDCPADTIDPVRYPLSSAAPKSCPMQNAIVAIFANVPEPGSAKRRLIPELGPDRAAALAEAFLEDTVAMVRTLDWAECIIAASSRLERTYFKREEVWLQSEGDLGERLEKILRLA